jgi:hypothetical protein
LKGFLVASAKIQVSVQLDKTQINDTIDIPTGGSAGFTDVEVKPHQTTTVPMYLGSGYKADVRLLVAHADKYKDKAAATGDCDKKTDPKIVIYLDDKHPIRLNYGQYFLDACEAQKYLPDSISKVQIKNCLGDTAKVSLLIAFNAPPCDPCVATDLSGTKPATVLCP